MMKTETIETNELLKNCPFCGEEPKYMKGKHETRPCYIMCPGCGGSAGSVLPIDLVGLDFPQSSEAEEEVKNKCIEKWNKRVKWTITESDLKNLVRKAENRAHVGLWTIMIAIEDLTDIEISSEP